MALITAIVLFLVGTLGTAISRLLTNEARAWTPRIIQFVIRRAIVRLHPAQRERFEEEWQGHVDEVPGEIGKLTVALGFLTAARRMTLAEKAEDAPLHRIFAAATRVTVGVSTIILAMAFGWLFIVQSFLIMGLVLGILTAPRYNIAPTQPVPVSARRMTLAEKAELGWLCIVLSFLIMGLIFLIVRLITYPGLIAISWPFVLIWLLTIVIAYRLNGRRRGEEQERLQQPESDQPSNLEREWISVLERERLWHGAHEANPGAPQSSIMRGHTV